MIFDGTGQEQPAQDFLNWLYKAENYTELSETSGFLPAVNGLTIDYGANAAAFKIYKQEIAGYGADSWPDQADGAVVRGQGACHRG